EAVEGLRRRSLLDRSAAGASFTLQSVVLEYVTDRLIEAGVQEIAEGAPAVLVDQPLVQATAKDYIRQSQERLIAQPLLAQLAHGSGGDTAAERGLLALLAGWGGRGGGGHGAGAGAGGPPLAGRGGAAGTSRA